MEVINLNLIPGKAWPVAHATQFDKGREFRANLFEGSQVYTLAGDETVDAIIKKPDGNQVTEALVNTADNYVIVTMTEQMTAVAGPNLGEIRITKGDTVIGSLKFILECEQSADTGIESHSEIHNLEAQVAAIVADQYAAEDVVFDNTPTAGHGVGFAVTSEGVKDAIDTAIGGLSIPEELDDLSDVTITSPSNGEILVFDGAEWVNQANPASTANFAADYDDTATYNTNDKVIYQGLYYIALEDNITGAWDSTKWELTTVSALTGDELPLSGNDSTPVSTAIGDLSQLSTTVQSSLVGAVNEAYSYKSGDTITLTNFFTPCVYDANRLRAIINLPKAVRNCSFSCSYLEVYINSTDSVQTNNITNTEVQTRTPNQLWVQFTGNFTNVSNNNAGIAVISGTITFS